MPKKKKNTDDAFHEALLMIAPGTRLREAISAVIQSGTGALLCFGDVKLLSELSESGVKVETDATPQLVYELSKMDGAIILNEDGSRIFYANRFLKPDAKIKSEETGTRHRTAQRLAAQAKCTVIAVSQRRSSVTLYVHSRRHVLDSISTLVNKATQAVQTLEKYLTVMQQAMQDLTTREFQDVVTIFDVCKAIQRTEMVERIAREIEPYILELGTEGRLIELQLQELIIPVSEARLVVKDYYKERQGVTYEETQEKITELSENELLNLGNISQALGYGPNLRSVDTYLSPRGYRVLHATHRLSPQIIENLVARFNSLQQIIRAPKDELVEVEGVGEILAERIRVSLNLLRNQLALDDRR
ncbi:MAG: DNA integrity scanning protein DisA [Candidatus Hydrogenedentes bacterium]|nr:DNA integrity scanning protein DisA [Candidatus Hydrogenedentota bacterium]MBI3119359.1 DNA integrity scanning protein DisA [Candidatus Hydrogenedentota bacterium]